MSRHNRERRRFQARRQPVAVICVEATANRGGPLTALRAFVEAHRGVFKPGVHQVTVEHDANCRYPSGGDCTCSAGPEIRIVGLDAGAN
jgi:hypothetical protein